MKHKSILKTLAALLLGGGGVLLLSLAGPSGAHEPKSGGKSIALSAPPFVQVANAAAAYQSGTSFLEDEAGIAAYTQTPGSIDLSVVRDEFRTIERETDQYIIGSVGIPDYSEDHDPHVYVHTDGWVLAYYLAEEPASYIIDLRHYDGVEIASTKLENAMNEILSVIGVVSFEATYYDFRYPNATHLMLIAEAIYYAGDESFDVQLPSGFTYYERSWSHALYDDGGTYHSYSTLYLDEVSINSHANYSWAFAHGSLTPAQLPPGVFHTVRIDLNDRTAADAFCGMALVYQEVP